MLKMTRKCLGLLMACALFSLSCTTDYVTGKRTFSLVSESQEIALGREADPQIVSEFGLYGDPQVADYVSEIGGRLAARSQRPNLQYTFRVLDSPVVNAFALPGGYVYITRGILAYFNSEDELAGVMGHEIGHVVARHSAEQISRAQLAGIGLGLGSLISEKFQKFAGIAQAGLGLLFLKFSRSQEMEADMLGVEYSTKLGYNAHKMAGFFHTLEEMSAGKSQSLPSFLSTHPDPGDRYSRVNKLADEWQAKIQYHPLNKKRYDYLRRINGIVYGDDPRMGYVEKGVFFHPLFAFQFPVPGKWNLTNTASTVKLLSPDKKAAIQLALGKGASPQEEAESFISSNKVSVIRKERIGVHGFPGMTVESKVKEGDREIQILSYFIEKSGKVFAFHGFTTPDMFGRYEKDFIRAMSGFREVKDPKVLNKKPKRLHIKRSPRNASLGEVLRSLGASESRLKELSILNEMKLSAQVKKGQWIKVISGGE